jgi:Holliday junction resolvase RusA-like endonuclease
MRVTHEELLLDQHPPLMRITIHGAPHRRMTSAGELASTTDVMAAKRMLEAYRAALIFAGRRMGIRRPIDYPLDLEITFVDPTSPDLDNLITAFYQAVDDDTGKPALVLDDGLFQKVTMMKMFPTAAKSALGEGRLQLPRHTTQELVA